MTLLTHGFFTGAPTVADARAAEIFSANLAALTEIQPVVAVLVRDVVVDVTWLFARDGSLTSMDGTGQWWGGCSLPRAASKSLLKSLERNGQTSCFLDPIHAGLLVAARERMGDEPALLAVVPSPQTLRVILSCHDFSADIRSHHLWLVSGEEWPERLRQLFLDKLGLPTPARFIKTKLTADEIVDPMISEAQSVFSAVLAERTRELESIRAGWETTKKRDGILVIAGSRYRLWEDGGDVLCGTMSGWSNVRRFDGDDPASSSPAALASAARDCGVVVAANISRGDAVNLVSPDTKWITWVTRPQVPMFSAAGPVDCLILADQAWKPVALAGGWPIERVAIAGWPEVEWPAEQNQKPMLAILADTQLIEMPKVIEEFSSHRLLWEHIQAELRVDPLAVERADQYLDDRAGKFSIASETLDRRLFLENLILPAYQQGLARLLLKAGLPLRLFGRDWEILDEFKSYFAGKLKNRKDMLAAAAEAKALVYVWPLRHVHAMDALVKPVIARTGRRVEGFIREAKEAMQGLKIKEKARGNSLGGALGTFLGR